MLRKHYFFASSVSALVLFALAGVGPSASAAEFAGTTPVSNAQLAQLRGGFAIGSGVERVHLSLGIERLTFVNGELKAITNLTPSSQSGLRLIQNGSGNQFDRSVMDGLADSGLGTVIQNSLDGQTIQNLNVFNVTLKNRAFAHSLSVGEAVRSSLARAMQ